MRQQHEALEEANNLSIIETGFPVPVRGNEQFELRINVLIQYLDNKMAGGEELSESTQQLVMMRLNDLLNAFEEVDANAARQLRKQLGESAQSLIDERQGVISGEGEANQESGVLPPEQVQRG